MSGIDIAIVIFVFILALAGIRKVTELILLFGIDIIFKMVYVVGNIFSGKSVVYSALIYSPIAFYDKILVENVFIGIAGLTLWMIVIFSAVKNLMEKMIKDRKTRIGLTGFVGSMFFIGFGYGLPNTFGLIASRFRISVNTAPIVSALIIAGEILLFILACGLGFLIPKVLVGHIGVDEGEKKLRLHTKILDRLGVAYEIVKIDEGELDDVEGDIFVTRRGIYAVVDPDVAKKIRDRKIKNRNDIRLRRLKEFMDEL